ncbi:unnamed protein product [Effrenium voratum]|nr:unnamed protein product [Effrenium voratum]CAJ1415227.1 unnamed protein product [Effrenium voratum]
MSPEPSCSLKGFSGTLPPPCAKLTEWERAEEPALVFMHNHKAGGSTMKEAINMLCKAPELCILFSGNQSKEWPSQKPLGDFLFTGSEAERRRVRAVIAVDPGWVGLCGLLPRPCVYLTTLRDPFYQLLSLWHFACLQGAQKRAAWNATERQLGRCERPITQFYLQDLAVRYGGPSARGMARAKQVELALQNLEHPCVWVVHTQQLQRQLLDLKERWAPHFARLLDRARRRPGNANPHPANLTEEAQYAMAAAGTSLRAGLEIWGRSFLLLELQEQRKPGFC